MNRTIKTLALVLAGFAALAAPAAAQDAYPSRNVRLLVSFPPGGGVDAVARLFADKMAAILGQTVVVENRGGAAGLIAGRAVAAADPDGYTVLVATNSMVVAQLLNASPGLSIERDLQAVASVAPQANILVAAPDLPVTTLKDVVALAEKRPLNYSSPGTGSVPQLLLAHLITTLPNAKITHVPFPGAAQALTATMSSQTELSVVTLPPAVPLVTSGKLKGLAVTTPQRSAAVKDVPTVVEAGYPSLVVDGVDRVLPAGEDAEGGRRQGGRRRDQGRRDAGDPGQADAARLRAGQHQRRAVPARRGGGGEALGRGDREGGHQGAVARVPDAVQREAPLARSGAPLIRDRSKGGVRYGPGSAAHHFVLRCARDTPNCYCRRAQQLCVPLHRPLPASW